MMAVRGRKDEKVYSSRKKMLRKTQLFEDFNLLAFFKSQIQVITYNTLSSSIYNSPLIISQSSFSAFNITADNLPILVNDQSVLEQFMTLINM